MKKKYLLFASAFLLYCLPLPAQTADTLKSGYHLFKPTPKKLMREMETDRPDATESAYSVDAGHFQLETDLFKTTLNKTGGIKTTETVYNFGNFKLGITNSMDFQVIVQSYVSTKIEDQNNNKISRSSGFGDITLRIKQNIWGNDGGKTALAMMPYINIPTAKNNDATEGGIVFPFAMDLRNGWGLGAQAQIDLLKNTDNNRYHGAVLGSVVVGKDFSPKAGFFVESFFTYDFREKNTAVYVDGGLTYAFTPNFKLDIGANIGLTKDSDKVYFTGFSFRY